MLVTSKKALPEPIHQRKDDFFSYIYQQNVNIKKFDLINNETISYHELLSLSLAEAGTISIAY